MKTITNQKIYQCEHCGKKGLSAAHMARHEKYCAKNPDVRSKCYGCAMLERITETMDGEFFNPPYKLHLFRCKATGLKLYSKQIEKKLDNYHYQGRFMAEMIIEASDGPMPLEKDGCEHFKVETFFDRISENTAEW